MSVNFEYQYALNMDACIENLGLEEKGRVQQVVTEAVLELSEPYVPKATGDLLASGHIENETDIVWDAPYARYMWNGIVYVDPDLHCAGFKTENGWRSRKKVQKVPTKRKLEYHNGSSRGSRWVERMLQEGGREQIENQAREAVRK